jgi:hypothetical protein
MLGAFVFLLCIFLYLSPHRYIAVFLLFVLVTASFQLVPLQYMVLPAAGIKKTFDWVLLFQGFILLVLPQYFLNKDVWNKFRILILYSIVLLVLLVYSIFFRQIEISVSIRVFRGLIFFTTIFLFTSLSIQELQKVFRLIIIFTSLAALLYCLQTILGKTLLNNISSGDMGMDSESISRYYNLPVYVYPVIFFLFFSKNLFNIQFKKILLFVNSMAILLTQHRNLIIAVLICYLIYILINQGLKMRNLVFYSIIGIGILMGVNSFLSDRLTQGFEDVSNTSFDISSPDFYNVKLSELSTTEFRQLLLVERINYVLKDNMKALFGLGLITDDSRKASALEFNVGMSDGYGNVTQVASSDIAWSTLLLQLGFLGVFVFILVHLFLLMKFFSERKNVFMQVGFLYIICLLLTSFYSNTIVLPYVTTFLMLFAAYYYNLTHQKMIDENEPN